jgi:hypothetical protein
MKWEDRPIWYDPYVLYPPFDEPVWDRKWPKHADEVRQLFYREDLERAAKDSTNSSSSNVSTPIVNASVKVSNF